MILAIKSSLLSSFTTGVGLGRTGRAGAGRTGWMRTGWTGWTTSTTGLGAFLVMETKPGSLVLVSLYPSASAVYFTVINDPRGST